MMYPVCKAKVIWFNTNVLFMDLFTRGGVSGGPGS